MKKRALFSMIFVILGPASPAMSQWQQVTPPVIVNSLKNFGNALYAAGNGIWVSRDSGSTWSQLSNVDGLVHSLDVVGTDFFAGGELQNSHAAIWYSRDSGKNWITIDNRFSKPITSIASGSGVIYLLSDLGDTLFRSKNACVSWEAIKTLPSSRIHAILADSQGVYVASDSGLFYSTDSGISWESRYVKEPVQAVAISDSALIVATRFGLYRTSNHGTSWFQSNKGLGSDFNSLNAFCFKGKDIVASQLTNTTSAYYSSDRGETWNDIGFIHRLGAFILTETRVIAGSINTGIWYRSLPSASVIGDHDSTNHFLKIYPNPTTISTTISITPEVSGYADISIVNMLGQTVAKVYSGVLDASEHTFTWEAQAKACATPGVYECVVRMNGGVQTVPIVVQ